MNAILLIGHGSLKQASGASMIRLATRLREQGIAPIAEASFLNYNRPTLSDGIGRCAALGATQIIIQPYFLINGKYVCQNLPLAIEEERQSYPQITFKIGPPFNEHPAMIDLVLKRVHAATDRFDSMIVAERTALLMMAHGTPFPQANIPLYEIAHQANRQLDYSTAQVAFLDCNEPNIPTAVDQLVEQGIKHIIAMPYFLQFGRHVREDLPKLMAEARQRHKNLRLIQTHHLDYDLRLVDAITHSCEAIQENH